MSNCNLFAIQDEEGHYVDCDSIWHEKETMKWHYTSYDTLQACVRLHKSITDAEKVIENLKLNMQKIDTKKDKEFIIKQII